MSGMFEGGRSAVMRRIAVAFVAAVFGGAAISLANTGGRNAVPNTGGPPDVVVHHHARKLSPSAARKRAALVARKRREGHHQHTPAHSASITTVGPGVTFADQGVSLASASSSASSYAATSNITTSSAAVSAVENLPAAESVFGPTLASNHSVSLLNVTEKDPVVPGVTAGVPYSAWVVAFSGPEIVVGRPGDGPPSATPSSTATCEDVAIYDVQISQWTELLQNC